MITVENLSMHYGSTVAVNDISFTVGKGEILGLLGPNGAGKSTTMKILTTFIIPTYGRCLVNGRDVVEHAIDVRNMIGYLPENAPLYVDMTVRDYLEFVGMARKLNGKLLNERLAWVVDRCGLKQVFHKVINDLSRGFKQRVGLAQALIHDPEVLILDEPTSGLDPLQIIGIRDLVKQLGKEKTIIFSTHILQEVVAVSDRVIIINDGELVADGSVEELTEKARDKIRTRLELIAPRLEVEAAIEKIGRISSYNLLSDGETTAFHLFSEVEIWEDVDRMIKDHNWPVKSMYDDRITFEEAFISLTIASQESGKKGARA